eukprot:TRINITY_DN12293_c0_g1_i2.p1 TRINITY_DN12293_c0_g1~~TRINITY_DN12293_c0_g1_i2.p1  ORF type:complete len:161 (+),score=51.35 TRINITY_DN12293_c0_g1_i2:54-536(+)
MQMCVCVCVCVCVQMRLATTNVELEEKLEELGKQNKQLEEQVASLSVFETGVMDMRKLLDEAIVSKDLAFQNFQRLNQLQQHLKLTWVPEKEVKYCMNAECRYKFRQLFGRSKTHCHYCGRVFCGSCCEQTLPLPEFGFNQAVRVCVSCYEFKTGDENKS